MKISRLSVLSLSLLIAACGSQPERPVQDAPTDIKPAPGKPKSGAPSTSKSRQGGGYYKDDGPAEDIPENLEQTPDAVPRWEPLHKPALRPYEVFGQRYVPNTAVVPYKGRGIASWYGKKFHGQKTSIGQPYDMFAMTAAHPTLALPSYVRVTSQQNGRSVVVRVIDRGPFHAGRIIDLSYTAAYKLGLIQGGSGQVEVEAIVPGDAASTTYDQVAPPSAALPTPAPVAEVSRLQPGVYLQLGAFANADNADSLKRHMERELDWLKEPMQILRGNGLHRVQLGPYSTRQQAETIAEQIRNNTGFKPSFVNR